MLDNDYFLAALKDEFVENARLFIFETYCRIHQCIDLRMLAGGLHPSHFHPGRHCLFVHSFRKKRPTATVRSDYTVLPVTGMLHSSYQALTF